jgi:class 3 adenylate cyclase
MIAETQIPKRFLDYISEEEAIYTEGTKITNVSRIPETSDIPLTNPNVWMKVKDVICVFVDMKNSTKLSAGSNPTTTAETYRLFTSTAVKLFHEVDAPYIDIKGDGVFALFDGDQPHRALAAAVTFKTFATESFIPKIKGKTGVDVGVHVGIDCKTVLVRRLGLKRYGDRTDRQNEVWAGKPVNMAAKLASLAKNDEVIVSDRFFSLLTNEKALRSCGCPADKVVDLWEKLEFDDARFDFSVAHKLGSSWCKTHGADFCENLLVTDARTEASGRGLTIGMSKNISQQATRTS